MTTPLRKWYNIFKIRKLQRKFKDRPYSEYYAAVMDERVSIDPKYAVGGRWDEIGKLQYSFLHSQGLKPEHTLLDFGCGSLRGGIRFIRYLRSGNYFGVDISEPALEAGREFLQQAGLDTKHPNLSLISGLELDEFWGYTFDFILAHSVLTHMPAEDIEILFENVPKLMGPQTRFFATYFSAVKTHNSRDRLNFYYPFETLRQMGARYNLKLTPCNDYKHPRRQNMLKIVLEQ